jgi:HD-GYP domain-containing protein (c-di-GMP phosphodiesterase class II)
MILKGASMQVEPHGQGPGHRTNAPVVLPGRRDKKGEIMEIAATTPEPQPVSLPASSGTDLDLTKLGNTLVTKFHVLMRVSQIYDAKNVTFRQFIQESLEAINALIAKEGSLSLKIVRDDLFLNDQRLRYSVEGFNSFKYLLTHWKKRLIGGVIFRECLDERTLKEFVFTMNTLTEGKEENAAQFNERMTFHQIHSIEVTPLEDVEGDDMTLRKEDGKVLGKKVFFETIGTIKEVITQIKAKQYPDVRKLKRLAQNAVKLVMQDESILLGLTTIKNYDEYTFNHSVNVSIFALAIGRRLGFSKKTMTELGITAMLHDLGKSKVPREVLNKPAALNDEEWAQMKKHPLMGVEIVLNLKQLGEINPKMVIGIFDHHLKNNLSGYPKLFRKKDPSLYGRIIQIVDVYDAMTTPRVYRKAPFTPDQALAIMLKDRGVHFDPVLLKIFIGLVGLFPIGSLVQLDTGEMAIVYKANPDAKLLDRPTVIVLSKDQAGEMKTKVVDLSEPNGGEQYKRTIVKTLDPNKYHIDIGKYFL